MRIALNYRRVEPSKGGAETYVADLARRLIDGGHEVALYAETWDVEAIDPAVRTVRVPAVGKTRGARIWDFAGASEFALRSDASRIDCTVGFINTWHQDVLIPQGGLHAASLEANAKRFPPGLRRGLYRLGKRANPNRWGLYRAIERKQYQSGDSTRFVAVSEMVRADLERFQKVDPSRVTVIPNAIDAGRLAVTDPAGSRRDFRSSLGLDESDLVGLFTGHNYRLKGLPNLLEALAARRDRSPDSRPIRLIACGGGDPKPLERLARSLGVLDDVRFLGFVPDVRLAYNAADFFALPTYYDPCSLVVFEALVCGLPVITTRQNGAGELITEGREGFVVESPDDRDGLIHALNRMAVDEERRAMSRASEALGRLQSFDRHVDRLLALFGEVAASKPATRTSRIADAA